LGRSLPQDKGEPGGNKRPRAVVATQNRGGAGKKKKRREKSVPFSPGTLPDNNQWNLGCCSFQGFQMSKRETRVVTTTDELGRIT